MSRLIAVILLAILMIPLGALLYLGAFLAVVVPRLGGDDTGLLVAGVTSWAFITLYWLALWRNAVAWTTRRRKLTLTASGAAVLLGFVIVVFTGDFFSGFERGFAPFFGTVVPPLLWVVATIFIWRETPVERAARVAGAGNDGLVCPTCGYNLTGLKGTRCPECGSEFTLDALIASQPGMRQSEVER